MKITFLADNKTENAACTAEWGLSVLVESCGRRVLFDVGASPMFAENAEALGIDLSSVDSVVISHGHYDHTQGMEAFCTLNSNALVYIHREAISEAYGADSKGRIEDENCGIRWSHEFVEKLKSRMVFTENTVKINENMTVTGNIKPLEEFPVTERFYRPVKEREDKFVEDPMAHEQILIVEESEGVWIFSGCSHTGIMAAVKRTRELFPDREIVGLVAGMHLYPASREEKLRIAEELKSLGIKYVFPVHCTGMDAILVLREVLGDGCITAAAGDIYEF